MATEDGKTGSIRFRINGEERSLHVPEDTPLLWLIREELGLKGTKFGCGAGLCGACTVHLAGAPVRSCQIPAMAAAGQEVTTIEGLGDLDTLKALQDAWIRNSVPQCGYCQSGQLMSAAALLKGNPSPSSDEIRSAMAGNICRCGTYADIEAAILEVAAGGPGDRHKEKTEVQP